MRLFLLLLLVSLTACTSKNNLEANAHKEETKAVMAPYTVHQYVNNLTSQLMQIRVPIKSNARIAVTSFYMADALDSALATGQADGLSQQIQESLLTQFTQLGYYMIEYRLENTLNLKSNADGILSRNINNLTQQQKIDFVITGSLTRQQHAYLVNARLVDTKTQRIVSAATAEIPINAMWGDEKIQQRGGQLYRSKY